MPPAKPPAKPTARPAAVPPSTPPPRPATSLTPKDIDQAKEDALLQLKIGRAAHYYAVIVSGALLFDALLVLFFPPNLLPSVGKDFRSLYFLIFPLLGGAYLAAYGLWLKWEEYQLWPWESHFSWTLGAFLFDLAIVAVYFAALFSIGPTGNWSLLPAYYPLTLVGISLPLIGLALTWSEWSQRKTVAVTAAILPVPIALVLYVPSLTSLTANFALALSLSAGAVLYQMSGSFLHLIASGTRAHERELISASQNRIAQVAVQLGKREEALRFRETTLIGREADVENAELALQRKLAALEEDRGRAAALETEIQGRSATLQRLQRELAVKLAGTNAVQKSQEAREAAIALREKDYTARLPQLSDREQVVIRREGEQVEREAVVDQKLKDSERRLREAGELEARLRARQVEIDRKTAELLRRESELAAAGPAGAAAPSPPDAAAPTSPEREARLKQLQEALDQQNGALGRRAAELKAKEEEIAKKSSELARRAEEARTRDAELARREAQTSERGTLADARVSRYDEILKTLEGKSQEVDAKGALLAQREEEADRKESDLGTREKTLSERAAAIERDRAEMDRLRRDIAVREKQVGALEDELRFRRQALERAGPETSDFSLAFSVAGEPGPAGVRGARDRRGRPSSAVPPEVPVLTEPAEPLRASTRVRFQDRAPTGTPRLDDLLLGGIPPKGHIMLIGDAFVGKEIALYSFLLEGLKSGEPSIVITAARAPDEIAQKIGLVGPQFHEYEQLGMVRWIDASIPESAPSRREATATRFVTKGPQDHAGILSSLVQAAKALGGQPTKRLRVAFFGLSATLAHADERLRLQFVQNCVGVLKPRNATALYALETGTLPESQMETVLSRMDGAIYFKQEAGKSYLSVQGVGEVESREWIEYRATNRALVIGSFSLERIR